MFFLLFINRNIKEKRSTNLITVIKLLAFQDIYNKKQGSTNSISMHNKQCQRTAINLSSMEKCEFIIIIITAHYLAKHLHCKKALVLRTSYQSPRHEELCHRSPFFAISLPSTSFHQPYQITRGARQCV